ncbi:energy transducer TonB [Niveispirillum sp. KHB5.9]|uniref:energy transducer TonB n=1 Tax=Niveispirillum sp. KHB5.9 TaxID=3400269 RepID=UPI003A86548E
MSNLSQSSYRRQEPQSSGRLVGVAVVVLLHVGVIYALMSGLARTVVQVIADPIQAEIVEEITPPPEDTPPPPPPPKFETPPPPYIPPPEVVIANPPPVQSAISTATSERPPTVQPPPRQVAAAPPAPPTGGKIDGKSIGKNRPEYPAQSIRLEEAGTTVMRLFCNADGRITDGTIEKSSGFERLDGAWMKEAKRGRWRCEPPTVDGKPQGAWIPSMVPLTFRLEDAR